MRRFSSLIIALLITASIVPGLVGCASAADSVKEAVDPVLGSYAVDKGSDESKDLPEPDFRDEGTAAVLSAYGVDMNELHKHCFARYSYSVGEPSVSDDGKSATVPVTITNVSLAAAASNAAADYSDYSQTEDAQSAYADNGRVALLGKLFDFLYQHLDSDDVVSTDVVLSLSKADDGSWKVDTDGNDAFFNALYGGSNVVSGLSNAISDANAQG